MNKIKNLAFTMLEMSITIAIIGILTVGGLTFEISLSNSSHKNLTLDRMNKISQALKIFFIENGRFPCPRNIGTASFGDELTTCTSSTGAYSYYGYSYSYGGVPVKTLGLSEEYAYDAWGNKIAYVIPSALTKTSTFFSGALGSKIINTDNEKITNSAVYVLISPGKDKKASYNKAGTHVNACSSTEMSTSNDYYYSCENSVFDKLTKTDGTYVKDLPKEKFDDIVIYEEIQNLIVDLQMEETPCFLGEIDYSSTSNCLFSSDRCRRNGLAELECDDGEISLNPSFSNKSFRKCLEYGRWSEIMYECTAGCGESNISSLTGGVFTQTGELASAIDKKYLKAPLGQRVTVQCVNKTVNTTDTYKGYVILECKNDGTWEFVAGDCTANSSI